MSKRKPRKAAAPSTADKAPNTKGGIAGSPQDRSLHVPQRDKLRFDLHIHERTDLTVKQRQLCDIINSKDSRLIMVDGPAGTSKTFLAVLCALQALNRRTHSDLLYVRSIIESASKSMGSLPGTSDEKLDPFLMPLRDKLDELLPRAEVDGLIKEERVTGRPVNFLRGAHFNARFIICDEAQNLCWQEIVTLITRMGQFSKMVLVGDKDQSDLTNGHRGGWTKLCDTFNDEESRKQGVHYFAFTKEDIVRSGLVRFLVERLEQAKAAATKSEPMFAAK